MLGKWFHRSAEPVDMVDLIASRRYLARITAPGDTRPPTRGDRAGLATDMAEALHYATVEAPDTPGDLYQRFILWTRWSPVERCRPSWRRRSR